MRVLYSRREETHNWILVRNEKLNGETIMVESI